MIRVTVKLIHTIKIKLSEFAIVRPEIIYPKGTILESTTEGYFFNKEIDDSVIELDESDYTIISEK